MKETCIKNKKLKNLKKKNNHDPLLTEPSGALRHHQLHSGLDTRMHSKRKCCYFNTKSVILAPK